MEVSTNQAVMLGRKINMPEIRRVVEWAAGDDDNIRRLYSLTRSQDERTGLNALWVLTHVAKQDAGRLQCFHDDLIDMLLVETHVGRKRMMLQLLREQAYDSTTIRSDFLDYCLSKINSECEPYAIRCFCMYCAFKMCRFYPELLGELGERLEMLDHQALSPGLKSALATTRKAMARLTR